MTDCIRWSLAWMGLGALIVAAACAVPTASGCAYDEAVRVEVITRVDTIPTEIGPVYAEWLDSTYVCAEA